jgi:hypothetical protein
MKDLKGVLHGTPYPHLISSLPFHPNENNTSHPIFSLYATLCARERESVYVHVNEGKTHMNNNACKWALKCTCLISLSLSPSPSSSAELNSIHVCNYCNSNICGYMSLHVIMYINGSGINTINEKFFYQTHMHTQTNVCKPIVSLSPIILSLSNSVCMYESRAKGGERVNLTAFISTALISSSLSVSI